MSEVTSRKLPVYRHHKPSGQARVRWQGREIYLGKFDAPESRQRYGDLLKTIVTGVTLDIDDATRRKRVAPTLAGLSISRRFVDQ